MRSAAASHAGALSGRRLPPDWRKGTAAKDLFVGDTLFAGSIGRTDLPGGDYQTLIGSIRTVLFAFGDDAVHPATVEHDDRRGTPHEPVPDRGMMLAA
jgi:glyoxylase-like metal-dependent hydrolase (beta-lactamase superfamily II)